MQKYNIGITEQDDGASPRSDYEPDDTEPSSVAEPPVTTDANNKDFTIGDLFNNVNPAVATVITYDSGNNKFNQGSGFFINEDGHFITNYHVVKGAYSVVVQMKDEIELKVAYVLAENEE